MNTGQSVDMFDVRGSFANSTAANENPKIGKVMRQLPADVKEATLNDQRSAAHRKWEDQKKASWLMTDQMSGSGLTDEEVEQRQAEEGFNELPPPTVARFWKIFLKHFFQAPPLCLCGQGVLYICLMQILPGVLNLIPGIGLAVWPACVEYFNSKMAGGDEDEKVKMCRVKRNGGNIVDIHPREVCRGDILIVDNGDCLAADARIIHGTDLAAIEMTLTGEPHDIKKLATTQFENKMKNEIQKYILKML